MRENNTRRTYGEALLDWLSKGMVDFDEWLDKGEELKAARQPASDPAETSGYDSLGDGCYIKQTSYTE